MGKTVTVPGSTVRLTLTSVLNDSHVASGYRVLNIAAVDPSNQPPVARLDATPAGGNTPVRVAFSAARSFDPDGAIVLYELDPGDGTPPKFARDVAHFYLHIQRLLLRQPTTVTAHLTVTDDKGATATAALPLVLDGPRTGSRARLVPGLSAPAPIW